MLSIRLSGVFLLLLPVFTFVTSCTPEEENVCKLPDCRCPGVDIPGGLTRDETPQIVTITFADTVSVINVDLYKELIYSRRNPNGAPISATFYISHEYNDYSMTHELYRKGHEIGLHSFSHQSFDVHNKTLWELEYVGQRNLTEYVANMNVKALKGTRVPFASGTDAMMEAFYESGLQYDNSGDFLEDGLWPYTADFTNNSEQCGDYCFQKSYPGFWIVPNLAMYGDDGNPCSALAVCLPVPQTAGATFNLLKRNFDRHYNGNRAPFGVTVHPAWFLGNEARKEGFKQFLDYLETRQDVYIVSVSRALEWIKRPTKIEDLYSFKPWQHCSDLPNRCTPKYNCYYPSDPTLPSERYMFSCQPCPCRYPQVGNPFGLC